MDTAVHKVIKNFLPEKELKEISSTKTFLQTNWFPNPPPYNYQRSIMEEASSFTNLSSTVGIEEWFHNPAFRTLPAAHFDKDEGLYKHTGIILYPLCSCILYIKVEDLEGANLHLIDTKTTITPESNMLVLLKPGIYHEVTEYISGIRSSVYLNPWNRELFSSADKKIS